MIPEHFHDVIAFLSFFLIGGIVVYATTPRKQFTRGRIAVGECLKPNPKVKGGSWRKDDIKIGNETNSADARGE